MRLWFIAVIEGLHFLWATRPRMARFPRNIIPIPPMGWVTWRLDTMYGTGVRPKLSMIIRDLRSFLIWRRDIRRLGR